jgi:hypothetical protein
MHRIPSNNRSCPRRSGWPTAAGPTGLGGGWLARNLAGVLGGAPLGGPAGTCAVGPLLVGYPGAAVWHVVVYRFLSLVGGWSGAGLEGGEVGVGLVDGLGVGLCLVVFGERPVDAGQARVAPFAFAGGDDQVRSDVLHRLTVRAAA